MSAENEIGEKPSFFEAKEQKLKNSLESKDVGRDV